MAKSNKFNNNDPFNKFNIEPKQSIEPELKEPKKDNVVNDKPKKTGRPKTKQGEYKTLNISVPVKVLEKLGEVKEVYQGNLTLYINKLIERDIEANYDKYIEIVQNLKMFQ